MKGIHLLSLCVILLLSSCESPTSSEPEKAANVIMFEGPIFEDGYTIFWYKGRVKNVGNANADFGKIYVYVRKSDNSLIAQEWSYIDDTDLAPQETSAWDVLFSDDNHAIRDAMDKSKTTYEIKWD